jgi:hypothetical protein
MDLIIVIGSCGKSMQNLPKNNDKICNRINIYKDKLILLTTNTKQTNPVKNKFLKSLEISLCFMVFPVQMEKAKKAYELAS